MKGNLLLNSYANAVMVWLWIFLLSIFLSSKSFAESGITPFSAPYGQKQATTHDGQPKQVAPRNDRSFAQMWKYFHDCKTDVYVEAGQASSEYLRNRGYIARDQDQKGYATFTVDERFEGFRVEELLLPTTWAIVAITVDAPVEKVKAQLENARNFRFSVVEGKHHFRKLKDFNFEIFPKNGYPSKTVIQCDSDQQ